MVNIGHHVHQLLVTMVTVTRWVLGECKIGSECAGTLKAF